MPKIIFTEEFCNPGNLTPFTLTRQVQDIRIGIFTVREKWERLLGLESFDRFEDDYKDLDRSVKIVEAVKEDTVYLIHGNVLPTRKLADTVKALHPGEALSVPELQSFVYCIASDSVIDENNIRVGKSVEVDDEVEEIKAPWDIFGLNAWSIAQDFELIRNTQGQIISASNRTVNSADIFIEEGAVVEGCSLNAAEGPIHIGRNAVVMEGSLLRGPVAICEGAVVKMGARIYGGTTIGPYCTAGGEIKTSVMFGYSNKAHDGYMGDSVVGEWCNWGAGTSNSNVKNNASDVVVWTPSGPQNVGRKCGVLMGDYSRTAINTAINTGTVIGVCTNVYGAGLTPKYVPSFSWGSDGLQRYDLEKAYDDITNWKRMKGAALTANEKTILKHIFDHGR